MNAFKSEKIPKETETLFVYLNVNSGPGVIGLPRNEIVFKDELIGALSGLAFKQIILYFDVPYAASFLKHWLPQNTYAVSAAGEFEMSWGTQCTPDEIVKGEHIKTCMSDLFSHFFIEQLKMDGVENLTLQQSFE